MSDTKNKEKEMRSASTLMPLLDCPFCGGKADIDNLEYIDDDGEKHNTGDWSICCMNCQIYTLPDSKEFVIKTWNTRAI